MKNKNEFKNQKMEKTSKLVIYTIIMFLTIVYIGYRIVFTLPFEYGYFNMIFAIIVLLIELFETIDFSIYYFNILIFNKKTKDLPKIKKKDYPDVDVFLATINEDIELLEETIKACNNMLYPNKKKLHIYICDDGNRKEIKKLASKYKINYITRKDNKGAKAGNYNNALEKTSSPFIAVFDADMKPTPYFLLKTIPYLVENNNLGFVQLPQSFNNPDIFQLRFGLTDKIPFEQDYFYHSIQLAKNKTNSTIFCGTNCALRREALDSIGGFALNTITEDIATGMLIQSKGYDTLALSDVQAYGNAVNDLDAFIKQRSRWARGCVQVLKNYNIVFNKGLNIRQKLEYLASISYWFYGVRRILYLIIPLLFSLFGIMVIDCNLLVFSLIFLPQYLLKRIALDKLEKNKRSSTWNKIYELVLAPILSKEVLKELFGFGSNKFEVTPKKSWSTNMTKNNKKLLSTHIIFLLFSILGIILSIYKSTILGLYVYLFPLIWLTINVFYLIIVIIFDIRVNPIYYDNFIPNKVKNYSIKSIIGVFTSIFKKKVKTSIGDLNEKVV